MNKSYISQLSIIAKGFLISQCGATLSSMSTPSKVKKTSEKKELKNE